MTQTRISCLWNQPGVAANYQAAVSLHSHTSRSKESLYFIPKFTEKHRFLQWALNRKCQTATMPVDLVQAYWTPPLPPDLALRVEREQIENTLGLTGLVALTDHDSIEAPTELCADGKNPEIPFSFEWSVPFENAVFHLGIHNLPPDRAQSLSEDLFAYTRNPSRPMLGEILEMLDENPEVMIVFNHPLWDLYSLGKEAFLPVVDRFLEQYAGFMHAFELNATRSCTENQEVIQLADRWQCLMISGGDRHGCEPSGAVNLTRAQSFSEFVHEIRQEKRSHILFMPQYAESLTLRTIQTLLDVIREYPEYDAQSRCWDDRVFHPAKSGDGHVPISSLWRASPAFIENIFSVIRVLERGAVRQALARVFPGKSDLKLQREVMDFSPEVAYEVL